LVLWGLALATLLPALRAVAEHALAALGVPGLSPRGRAIASAGFTALVLGFIASQNNSPRLTGRMVFPGGRERPYRFADWNQALPRLRPLADSADVVVSSYILNSLYYLDRGDVALSVTETAESGFADGRPIEFSIDERTGRPAISTPESLRRVMDCFRSGLVLIERFHLNRPHMVPEETSRFILAHTMEVPMPPDSWVHAYRWRHAVAPNQPGCPPWQSSGVPPGDTHPAGK
jgi:hypothetical protein